MASALAYHRAGYFSGLDFIARLTLHPPPKGKHLVRRYGVYSSRARGTWKRRPAPALRAAAGWYGRDTATAVVEDGESGEAVEVSAKARRKAWARLLAKVYEIDLFCCPKCDVRGWTSVGRRTGMCVLRPTGGRMSVVAVIRDPGSIRDIIACLEGHGRGPALSLSKGRRNRH